MRPWRRGCLSSCGGDAAIAPRSCAARCGSTRSGPWPAPMPTSDFLLRRHDYRVDIAGGFAAIQYVYDMVEAQGIKLPSKRRAYRCDATGRLIADELMVSIDVSNIHLRPQRHLGDSSAHPKTISG